MPIGSETSEARLGGQTPMPTDLSSKGIREGWTEALRRHAVFSARTTSKRYAEAIKKALMEVASRVITPQQAEERLKRTLSDIGYSPALGFRDGSSVPAARPGDIRDLSSSRRIQLILDTNVKQARSLGQMAAGESPLMLMTVPAWRLTRTGARKKPRGDWKKRWQAAGDKVAWKGALRKSMVALKTSPIWQAIADGAGGFEDTLGSPYPPFAFGSGLAWVGVQRGEWKKLCAGEGVPDGLDGIKAKAKELSQGGEKGAVAPPSAVGMVGGTDGTDGVKGLSGGSVDVPGMVGSASGVPMAAPLSIEGVFSADFRRRKEANDTIDMAADSLREIRERTRAAVERLADIRTEAGLLAGKTPKGEARRLLTAVTGYRKAVGAADTEVAALEGRVAGYGRTVESEPVPRNGREQAAFDSVMVRYIRATRIAVGDAEAQDSRAWMLRSAAERTVARMREMKSEFTPDTARRAEALDAVARAAAVVSAKAGRPEELSQSLDVYAPEYAAMKARWPAADFSKGDALLADARNTVAMLAQALADADRELAVVRTAVESAPEPVNEETQVRFDTEMDAKKAEAEAVAGKVSGLFGAFRLIEVLTAVEDAAGEAVQAEKRRICDGIMADAQTRAAEVVADQVADILAGKKTVDKEAKADGVHIEADSALGKAWTKMYNAARSARSNVRKLLSELKAECDRADVDAAKVAKVKFESAIDYCLKRYQMLQAALEEWTAEIERLKGVQADPDRREGDRYGGRTADVRSERLKHADDAFPKTVTKEDIENAKGGIGGSTGAKLLTDSLGRKFIVKQTNATRPGDGKITREHLENEIAADRMYRAAGIRVPDVKEYEVDGKPVKLATYVPNAKPLGEWMRSATEAQKADVRRKLVKGFLVDALLANWDVVGQGMDNILVDEDGEPWRIDNGSGMRFRARGVEKKADEWEKSSFPDEWRTLRDQNASVFGGFTAHDIFSQDVDWDAVVDAAPEKEKPVLERRVRELKEMQARCRGLDRAGIVPKVSSEVLEATYDLAKSGLREAVPKVSVSGGLPSLGYFRPSATAGRPVGLSPADSEMQTVVDKLTAAAKSVNHHAETDGTPNWATVQAALDAIDGMKKLRKKGIDISAYEQVAKELKAVKKTGQTEKVSMVPAYKPQQKVKSVLQKYGSLSEWKYDFIARGGVEGATPKYENYEFVRRAGDAQGGNSWTGRAENSAGEWVYYAALRKVIEFKQTGKNPDPDSGSPNNESYGFLPGQKDAYRRAWEYYKDPKNRAEMERAEKAIALSRAFTIMELENAGLPNYDPDTQTILLARTENKTEVMPFFLNDDGMKGKAGEFGNIKVRGNGESMSAFRTVSVKGGELLIQRFPVAAISDTYLTLSATNDRGGFDDKYLGDGENEFHVDLTMGLDCYYAGRVGGGKDLAPYYEEFMKAEANRKKKPGAV